MVYEIIADRYTLAWKMLRAFILVCLSTLCRSQAGAQDSKYVTIFETPIYVFVGEEYVNTNDIVVENYNETTAFMVGEIHVLQPLTDLILEIVLQKEASGKWELMFSHDVCDFCAQIGDENSTYKKYFKYFEFPKSCPFEPGSYTIRNLVLEMEEYGMNDQHLGKYLAELNIYQNVGESCNTDRKLLFTTKIDLTIEKA